MYQRVIPVRSSSSDEDMVGCATTRGQLLFTSTEGLPQFADGLSTSMVFRMRKIWSTGLDKQNQVYIAKLLHLVVLNDVIVECQWYRCGARLYLVRTDVKGRGLVRRRLCKATLGLKHTKICPSSLSTHPSLHPFDAAFTTAHPERG